jgi:lipopolysaccharide transport system ATP-binding protein
MTDTIVSVSNVSKKYCRNLKRSLWYGVKDIVSDMAGRSKDQYTLRPQEFWALQDIAFELEPGQSLGLVGRNGAGKTTLLKLINGLIKPTAGKISIRGSLGALIALGTGFNPVLTGRENVKIAGSVLGMSPKQMDEKLDEIVDFSEIREFIDTPVKSYSSGMLVRLGFSVAIQLQPDLLLVDEVLAVGDLGFAVKCMKKITEYRNNGGSMILVSHAMHNIRFHCDKALWMERGRIVDYGPSHAICDAYELSTARAGSHDGEMLIADADFAVGEVDYPIKVAGNQGFGFEIEFLAKRAVKNPIIVFAIFDIKGQHMIWNYSNMDEFFPSLVPGSNKVRVSFPSLPLANGVYSITVVLHENQVGNHLVVCKNSFSFEVTGADAGFGLLATKGTWSIAHE